MLEGIVLGLASLWHGTPMPFFEETATLPAATFAMQTDAPWNAVTLFSQEKTLPPAVEFLHPETNEWTAWEPSEDNPGTLQLLFFSDPRHSLKLRTETETPVVFHFFNTHRPGENLVAQLGANDQTLLNNKNLPESLQFPEGMSPRFFTRSEWGADESLRWESTLRTKLKPGQILRRWFHPEIAVVPPKYKPETIRTEENGERLFWPIKESPKIEKFVIHHTAENEDSRARRYSPKELLRAIYFYHTVTNGWGDIGYNYIVDKQGNIYEGRSGGPRSVGAHTAYHNVGSVGICLMGNFQYESPTDAQIHILSLLLADLSDRLEVDPLGRTDFLGKNSYNVSGHSQVARYGHGTACPGKNLLEMLPLIRLQTKQYLELLEEFRDQGPKGKDFLSKSTVAPQVYAEKKFVRAEKKLPFEPDSILNPTQVQRKDTVMLQARARNNTDKTWLKGTSLAVENVPEGSTIGKFYLSEDTRPGSRGIFQSELQVKKTPNGLYYLKLSPTFLADEVFESLFAKMQFFVPFQVSGDKSLIRGGRENFVRQGPTIKKNDPAVVQAENRTAENAPPTKIKIAGFDDRFAEITADKSVGLWTGSEKIAEIPAFTAVKVFTHLVDGKFPRIRVKIEGIEKPIERSGLANLSLKTTGTLTIENYQHPQFGSAQTPYNQFRDVLHLYPEQDESLLVVNELSIEKYLWGLGEEPSTEPETKRHVIHILARSYALVYSTTREKFPTDLYDLEDDPRTSQLYLGKMWENYHTEQKSLVQETAGEVLTKDGVPVIGPYYTQSDGRSINPWKSQYPWARERELPYDKGLEKKGHGVGLSGNSARVLAEQGKSAKEIIDYFFEGLEVQKVY